MAAQQAVILDLFDNLVLTRFCCISVGAIHESPVCKIKQNLISTVKTKDLLTKFFWFFVVIRAIRESPLQKSNQIQFTRKNQIKFSPSEFKQNLVHLILLYVRLSNKSSIPHSFPNVKLRIVLQIMKKSSCTIVPPML